jgi:hypothetical protein
MCFPARSQRSYKHRAPETEPAEDFPLPKDDVDWWVNELMGWIQGCRGLYDTKVSHLREVTQDLAKEREIGAQLEMALAARNNENIALKKGHEALQAQLQAAHEELTFLKEANRQLEYRLARTGPPLSEEERHIAGNT